MALAATATVHAASDPKAIRKVDFRNFTYNVFDGDGKTTTLVDGKFERTDKDNPLYAQVLDVDHGDLDGDGIEEAIVTTLENTGGTGQFTDGLIFRLVGGTPKQIGDLGIGDRADGGIHGITIVNGRIVVERYSETNSGACCPTAIERETLKLTAKGGTVAVAKTSTRAFIRVGRDDSGAATIIKFLKGTSSATLEGDGVANDSGALDAGKGQTLTYTVSKVENFPNVLPAIVTLSIGSSVVAKVSSGGTWTGKLPSAGRYTLTWSPAGAVTAKNTSSAYATVDLTIR